MEERIEPEAFYGAAIAALVGLLFGLLLHTAWQNHSGGPRIILSSTVAAAPARADAAASPDNAPAGQPDAVQLAEEDTGPVTPDPLPVTRLAPEMFPDMTDVQPAAADEAERQDADDVTAGDAPQADTSALD